MGINNLVLLLIELDKIRGSTMLTGHIFTIIWKYKTILGFGSSNVKN